MRNLFWAAPAICLAVSACSTTGPYELAADLEPGTSTLDDAIELMGEPYSHSVLANGTELYQWFGRGLFPGDHVAILFDQHGVMIQTQIRTRTMTRI